MIKSAPIVVDLDGTLIQTDMLQESALQFVRLRPFKIFLILFWLCKGKAVLKHQLAKNFHFNVKLLPYNKPLIQWLRKEKIKGKLIVLSTASDYIIARKISKHLKLFDIVIASNERINNSGLRKANELIKRFGVKSFDYIGNAPQDLDVWKYSRYSFLVNVSASLEEKARKVLIVKKIFHKNPIKLLNWINAFRLHQWLKNILLFVPLIAAQQFQSILLLERLLTAFISFGLCASSVYIINDLFDLENDRAHPGKSKRPFASGNIPISFGIFLIPLLFAGSFFLAQKVGVSFLFWLLIYSLITFAYSFGLKRLILIDCITLAILYTLRIVAGAAAISLALSFWLLAFSVFLFFSLAFVKRYTELHLKSLGYKDNAFGRGYMTSDASVIQMLGISSGFIAVLILAFYINSDSVIQLYRTPKIIWGSVPLMLFWVSWIWIKAHRGEVHDDPIIFAIKDKSSILIGLFFLITFFIAGIY